MIDGLFGTVRFVVKNSNFFFTICVIGHLTWFKKGGLMGFCDLVIKRPLPWLKRCHVCGGLAGVLLAWGSAQAAPVAGVWHWSAGWQHYSEAQMALKGPELGLHWQIHGSGPFTLEADATLGLQNYSSEQTGRLSQVPNIDTRWRALKTWTSQPQWQYGLGLHTHSNFLRGTTTLGFGGYDRLSTQLWLPLRWRSEVPNSWVLDAGYLLWGEHVSRLSQTSASLSDVRNVQRKGAYLQASTTMETSLGQMQPFVRLTWVGDSDIQQLTLAGEERGAYEPANKRWLLGVKWQFR